MDALDGTPCRAGFRKQRMHEDIATVTTTCQKDQTCPFTGFRLSESCLKFKYVGKIGIFQYTLTFTDDYPENSYLMCDDQHDSLRVFNVPATEIFTILAKEMYQEMSFPRSPSGNFIQNSSVVTDGAEDYSDYSEDDLDDIGEDYYDREEPTSGDSEMLVHPLLKQDMDMVRALFGENAVGFRVFQSIDDMDVDLKLNMAFLETEVARAWRVNPMEPLTVRLHLSMSRYLDHPKPKIEVFIQSQKEKFGAVNQVKKIVENFLLDHWDKLSNNAVLSQYTKDRKFEKCLQKENTRSSEASTNHCANDALVAQLMDLGFSSESSQNALVIARGNVEEAANLLISNPEKCMTMACDAKPFSAIISSIFKPKDPNPLGGQVSEAKLQRSLSSVDPKEMPPLEFGFLVQLYQYCRQRVRTLNEFCVICDEKHAFHSGSMLKPVVCSRELCVFSFQTLGVMSDAADSIAMQAEVVDLLIAMARSACKSSRKLVIFDPFPSVVNPGKPTELALNPKNKEDHMARAESALDSLPPMHEMIRHRQSDLKAELDRLNVLAYPLLTWIISSNRCHIVKLPSHKCSQSMRTPHQFLLLSSAPAKEEAFREAKKKYKSTFAFHGSNIENWHSILRHGLYNATGTKFQCHGSAYGSGIYLSPMSNTSFGYCNKLAIAPPLPPRYAVSQSGLTMNYYHRLQTVGRRYVRRPSRPAVEAANPDLSSAGQGQTSTADSAGSLTVNLNQHTTAASHRPANARQESHSSLGFNQAATAPQQMPSLANSQASGISLSPFLPSTQVLSSATMQAPLPIPSNATSQTSGLYVNSNLPTSVPPHLPGNAIGQAYGSSVSLNQAPLTPQQTPSRAISQTSGPSVNPNWPPPHILNAATNQGSGSIVGPNQSPPELSVISSRVTSQASRSSVNPALAPPHMPNTATSQSSGLNVGHNQPLTAPPSTTIQSDWSSVSPNQQVPHIPSTATSQATSSLSVRPTQPPIPLPVSSDIVNIRAQIIGLIQEVRRHHGINLTPAPLHGPSNASQITQSIPSLDWAAMEQQVPSNPATTSSSVGSTSQPPTVPPLLPLMRSNVAVTSLSNCGGTVGANVAVTSLSSSGGTVGADVAVTSLSNSGGSVGANVAVTSLDNCGGTVVSQSAGQSSQPSGSHNQLPSIPPLTSSHEAKKPKISFPFPGGPIVPPQAPSTATNQASLSTDNTPPPPYDPLQPRLAPLQPVVSQAGQSPGDTKLSTAPEQPASSDTSHPDLLFGGPRNLLTTPPPASRNTASCSGASCWNNNQAARKRPRSATMQKPAGEGRFMYGTQLKCIALCEVIDSDQLKKNGDIWVMPVADHVCTRFFFVYEASTQLPATIDTRQPAFIKEIQKALGSSVD